MEALSPAQQPPIVVRFDDLKSDLGLDTSPQIHPKQPFLSWTEFFRFLGCDCFLLESVANTSVSQKTFD